MNRGPIAKYFTVFAILFLVSQIFVGCSGCKKDKDTIEIPKNLPVHQEKPNPENQEVVDQIVNSFPSPVEVAAIIKDMEVPFSKKYLVDPGVIDNYDINFKKAFGLGVLSADLGYLNVYERTTLIVEYLSAIKRLADDLRVGQFFDFQAFKRLATSNENLDSLVFLSVNSFSNMNHHLQENARGNLSLLMVTGVWLEGLYLMTQVYKEHPNDKLKELIGDQKTIFTILYQGLKLYNEDEYFKKILDEFKKIDKIYSQVTITYEKVKPTHQATQSDIPVYEQEERSVINITDQQINDLINITEQVRNKLINL